VDAGKVDNTATATSDQTTPVEDSATVPAAQAPNLSVTKGVSTTGDGDFAASVNTIAGATVYYHIVVSNIGNVTLTGVTLADSRFNLANLGCIIPTTLAVNASFT